MFGGHASYQLNHPRKVVVVEILGKKQTMRFVKTTPNEHA